MKHTKTFQYCFHSFEVGFGLYIDGYGHQPRAGFHSFEVGFGLEHAKKFTFADGDVFIPSR